MVNFWRSIWKYLHRAEIIYTGTVKNVRSDLQWPNPSISKWSISSTMLHSSQVFCTLCNVQIGGMPRYNLPAQANGTKQTKKWNSPTQLFFQTQDSWEITILSNCSGEMSQKPNYKAKILEYGFWHFFSKMFWQNWDWIRAKVHQTI